VTRYEFGVVMNYIGVAVRKPLRADELDVYFDLLGDLDQTALQVAAKRVLLEHKYPTFPSVAELRAAATATTQGEVTGLSGPEAFALAWKAVGRIDLEVDGSKERALKNLPPVVAETLNALGLANVIYGEEPVAVIRAQFVKAFEAISARRKREALLPAPVREAIEANARPAVLRLAEAFRTPEAVS
jgi:hypothetical protein